MDKSLNESYSVCENIAKKRAKNFYYAFAVLPKSKRRAVCAMYAFMRYCDDISDSDKPNVSKMNALDQWKSALDDTLGGNYGRSEILPAFHDTIRTFDIPANYFYELIDGAGMDMHIDRYATFDDLYEYCYKVASVVGLVCIHIFGFDEDVAKYYAEYTGIAFQLTNILRDIKEDGERNRIYLPLEDLEKVGYSEEDLLHGVLDERFRDLMKLEVDRARKYYDMGAPLFDHIDTGSRSGLTAMVGIYSSILNKIEQRGYDVFSRRVTLSTKEKVQIAGRAIREHISS